MITIDGIPVSDYGTVDTGAAVTLTVATQHNAALSGFNVNDIVTIAGNVDGAFSYDGEDTHGQKCFSSI